MGLSLTVIPFASWNFAKIFSEPGPPQLAGEVVADGDLALRERAAAPAEPTRQRECAGERRRLD